MAGETAADRYIHHEAREPARRAIEHLIPVICREYGYDLYGAAWLYDLVIDPLGNDSDNLRERLVGYVEDGLYITSAAKVVNHLLARLDDVDEDTKEGRKEAREIAQTLIDIVSARCSEALSARSLRGAVTSRSARSTASGVPMTSPAPDSIQA